MRSQCGTLGTGRGRMRRLYYVAIRVPLTLSVPVERSACGTYEIESADRPLTKILRVVSPKMYIPIEAPEPAR